MKKKKSILRLLSEFLFGERDIKHLESPEDWGKRMDKKMLKIIQDLK